MTCARTCRCTPTPPSSAGKACHGWRSVAALSVPFPFSALIFDGRSSIHRRSLIVGVNPSSARVHARRRCPAGAHTGVRPHCTAVLCCIPAQRAMPHLCRDRAHPCRICARTGLTPPTSAPGLGSPRPHLRRDPIEYWQVGSAHLFDLSFSQVGRCIQVRACLPRVRMLANDASARACVRACVDARA